MVRLFIFLLFVYVESKNGHRPWIVGSLRGVVASASSICAYTYIHLCSVCEPRTTACPMRIHGAHTEGDALARVSPLLHASWFCDNREPPVHELYARTGIKERVGVEDLVGVCGGTPIGR